MKLYHNNSYKILTYYNQVGIVKILYLILTLIIEKSLCIKKKALEKCRKKFFINQIIVIL